MRFLILLILPCTLPILALMFDIFLLDARVGERSATEFLQSFALLLTIVCLLVCALQDSLLKQISVAMAGMAGLALIREQDTYFDLIYHGAWLPFALILLTSITVYVFCNRTQTRAGLRDVIASRPFPVLSLGGAIVLIQSRLFGTGKLWRQILEPEQAFFVKTIVQEGFELTGYLIILVASYELMKANQKRSR